MKVPHTLSEFEQTYYYKTELVKLCRQLELPTSGTKAELNSYIREYLNGTSAARIKPLRHKKSHRSLAYEEINLDTKLLDSGFSFNQEARKWFADYFGVKRFLFSKQMAIIKRKAEVEHDTEMTVGDLILEMQNWDQSKTNLSVEEGTYQWNNFVRDFFKDQATAQYRHRLKVASILWKKIRMSKKIKIYRHDLLKKYDREIKEYK
ncbi:SAP domain-containing protein [Limosilactobacillus reuteri]|uniref:SAP domain-containing protein n=1 Tax=Limosilactobacillus reuteri TaxID=1598 RepID=UPI00030A8028|nr:SAP domain-containing protein [Limosilactobacillus reuteri]